MSDWAGFWIGLAMLIIAFRGEPDLISSVIYDLTGQETWEASDPAATEKE